MAETGYWGKIAKEAIEEFMRWVEQDMRTIYDEIFPMLVEKEGPAKRKEFYAAMDWPWLETLDPHLYAKLSKDALDIEEREEPNLSWLTDESVYGLGQSQQEELGLTMPMGLQRFA